MTGYRQTPTSDPEEGRLRALWYETRASGKASAHARANAQLSAYLWKRASDAVAEDRRKHPKAKRNLPVGAEGPSDGGRHLP